MIASGKLYFFRNTKSTKMRIIVEGAKCVGKSTLCNKLVSKFGGTIVHFPTNSETGKKAADMLRTCSTPEEYDRCQEVMEQDIDETLAGMSNDQNWILDRSFISNAVYRNTRFVELKSKYFDTLDNYMIIMMLASTEDILKWAEARVEKPITDVEKSKLATSADRFKAIADCLGCVPISGVDDIAELTPEKYVIIRK